MSIFTPARRVLYAPPAAGVQVPYVIDRHRGVLPSYATDFAHSVGESEYPELWKGLVGFWPFFLGNTGGVVKDLSGNGNHLTSGNSTWLAGPYGSATKYVVDQNQEFLIEKAVVTDFPFTVVAWALSFNDTKMSDIFWLGDKDEVDEFCALRMAGTVANDPIQAISFHDGNSSTASKEGFTQDKWHQIVGVFPSATTRTAGIDGVLGTPSVGAARTATGWDRTVIGSKHHCIDHIVVWNRVLSASEIAFLTQEPTALVQLRRRAVMVSVGEVGEAFLRTITDGVGIVDTMSRSQDLSRTITDGVGTADTVGRTQVQIRTLAETLGLTDSLWKAETRIFADAVGIADMITKTQAFARTIADDVGLVDSESKLMTHVRTLAESLGITDIVSKTVDFPRAISDDVGITDSVTKTVAFARVVADAMGISDVVTKTQAQLRTIADTMGLTDAMTPGQLIVFAEAMGITDTMTHTKTQIRVIADSLGITDDLTRIAAYVFTQSDDVGIGDAMIRVAVALRTISDDVGMTDTMSSISELVKAAWAFMLLKKSN